MIDDVKIKETLNKLDDLYKESERKGDKELSNIISKLSLIEFCGWIENSMDDIIETYLNRKLRNQMCISMILDRIEHTHGFLWEKHFRPLLCYTIGAYNLEILYSTIGNQIDILKDNLTDELWETRGIAAHEHTIPSTDQYETPSVYTGKIKLVFDMLQHIQIAVGRL